MGKNAKIKKGPIAILTLFLGIAASVAQNKPAFLMLIRHYLPGIINIRDFANPAPASGLIALDYNVFLSENKFYGADGDRVKQITDPLDASINLNVDTIDTSNLLRQILYSITFHRLFVNLV